MGTAHEDGNFTGNSEISRFERIITDRHLSDDFLLAEFTQLHERSRKLERRVEKLAAENEQLKKDLVNMVSSLDLASRVDGMTGLANRRDIMEKIDREASRSHRHQRAFTVLLINIDKFKLVNDTYGYNAGDDVLVEVSRVLRGCIRNEDICARWGGEEFLMLLPETTVAASLPVANKVLESISMTEFKANKPGIRITVSVGICEHEPSQTVQECISRVHQALSMSKQGGRNRYIIAT
jgi:diguanylate cyclase (GGDEF)-like protein